MATLKQGSKGEEVKKVQKAVGVTADGIFGAKTKQAVINFQKSYKLIPDGIVGAKTWAVINNPKEPKTAHFKMSEFKCKDGTSVPRMYWGNNQTLMNLAEEIRKACGNRRVTILSGYRTEKYNKKVGGAKNSQHLYALAADIVVDGVAPAEVYKIADRLNVNGGVGKYATFTHIDCRGKYARW